MLDMVLRLLFINDPSLSIGSTWFLALWRSQYYDSLRLKKCELKMVLRHDSDLDLTIFLTYSEL